MAKAYQQCRRGVGAVRVKLDAPGAAVLIDGVPAGEAPLLDEVFVDPGEHVFDARLEGFTGAPQRLTIQAGEAIELALALAPLPRVVATMVQSLPRRRSPIPGLAMAAVAALGLGSGAAFLGVSGSRRSDARVLSAQILGGHGSCVAGAANYDAGRCPSLQSALRADDAFHDVAVGAFVVGGAAAAATAAWFLWPQQRTPSNTGRTLRVTPVVGAGDGALVVSGTF
jgi:hypothetical protein